MSKKSALLIGCNYLGTALTSDGNIDTIHTFDQFLTERMFVLDSLILCDAGTGPKPTKQNIMEYYENMLNSANKGDVLFLVYAGASQILSKDAVIVPSDYIQNGYINGNDFRSMLDMVPEGVTLFCVSDSVYATAPVSLRYEVTDISTGNLSLKQKVANNRKIPNFSNYNSKQTVIENIPVHETDSSVLFLFGLGDHQLQSGYILWSLIQTMDKMHLHGLQLNHLLTRMQATIRFNDKDINLKLFCGQFMEMNVTFGRFVSGNI